MLTIIVPGATLFDDETLKFIVTEPTTLHLEHSLVALSRWESKWEKPFLGPEKKTTEETFGYLQAMSEEEIPPDVYGRLTNENFQAINDYIEAKMTATWFKEVPGQPRGREIITADIIYYWMIALQIPIEFEKWHLNRLFTQIRVVNEKNKPQKKGAKPDLAARRALNEQRMRDMQTQG